MSCHLKLENEFSNPYMFLFYNNLDKKIAVVKYPKDCLSKLCKFQRLENSAFPGLKSRAIELFEYYQNNTSSTLSVQGTG